MCQPRIPSPGCPGGGHLSATPFPTMYLFTGTHVTDDRGCDFEAVTQGRGFHLDNSLPVSLREAADMLPANVLKRLHTHIELALKEGTHHRGEPALLDHSVAKTIPGEEGRRDAAQSLAHAFPAGPFKDLPLPHG